MSLILEALRKSEAERRRGQAPDLFAELPPAARPRAATMPAWPWLAVTAVAALALAWWWLDRAPPAGKGHAPAAIASPDAGRPQPPPVDPSPAAARVPPSMPAPAMPAPAIPRRVAAAPPAFPETRPGPQEIPTPAPVPSPPRATGLPPAPSPPSAPTVATPMAAPVGPVPPPAEGGALAINALPADQRKALPPLKLTMHLWNETPARRVVILDGQRLGEGGRIGELVIAAIEPDAVLFDWNGRRLRLPLR